MAQTLLELVLRTRDLERLVDEVPDIVAIVESLAPFTQRHYDRLQLLTQQATFLDYLWNSMKLDSADDKEEEEEEDEEEEDDDDAKMDVGPTAEDVRDSDSGVMEEEEEEEEEEEVDDDNDRTEA